MGRLLVFVVAAATIACRNGGARTAAAPSATTAGAANGNPLNPAGTDPLDNRHTGEDKVRRLRR